MSNIAQIREIGNSIFCAIYLLTKSAGYDIMEILRAWIVGAQLMHKYAPLYARGAVGQ